MVEWRFVEDRHVPDGPWRNWFGAGSQMEPELPER
jgi:hypothetical protein